MTPETFRGAGPAEVLGAVIRRSGDRVDPALLASRFELHEDPASLFALVEVAREWGFSARAFRGEVENLTDVPLPAVVHLRSTLEGEGSFGVLVGIEEDVYELEDPESAGTRRLTAEAFAATWTGVVVTFTRAESPAASPRDPGAFTRWTALVRADRQAGVLVAARLVATIGVVALALASAMRLPGGSGSAVAAAALVGVDVLVAATCIVLFHASRRTRVASATPRLAQRICGRGGIGDCEGVLGSKWARIGGFDLPVVGLAFAGSNVVVAAITALAPPAMALSSFAWIAGAHVLATPASLFFIGLQVWPLRRFCPLCMTVHAGVLAGAALVVPLGAAASVAQTPSTLALLAIVHGVAFLSIAGLVVPLLELTLEAKASRIRLGWISATPWGALAEAAGRTPTFSIPPASAFRIGTAGGSFRIDALVHPFCSGCGPVVDGLVAMNARRAGTFEIAFHVAPRDPKDPGDRALCAGVSAIGLIAGGDQAVHVFRAIKSDPRKYLEIARDGAERLVASFLPPSVEIAGALPVAIEAVERASGLADALRTGTPTLLVNGRVWESTLDDLDAMIDRHPEIVASVLR
jgi:uncharacterized membrane protein/predicted double-glycine peptidase